MSVAGKKFKYIENCILEDWGMDVSLLVAAVTLAHGRPPPTKRRPFFDFKEWKGKVAQLLIDMAPEARRAYCVGYTPMLVPYLVRAHFGNQRMDNYYHEQVIYQVKAARKRVRDGK